MNTEELLDIIEKKLQDPSFDREEDLLRLMNQGLMISARKHLENLQASDTVTAIPEENSVAMPADYHHSLFKAFNITRNKPCVVCYQRHTLIEMYLGDFVRQGIVEAVVAEGGFLHYRKEPNDPEDIMLYYYRYPTMLEDSAASEPDCLPVELREQILVNFVLWKVYSDLEDGWEGHRPNTEYYENEFGKGIVLLDTAYPKPSTPRPYFPRTIRTF